jgi:hypothetical protein
MESVDSVAITCINSFQDEGNSKFSLIYMLYNYNFIFLLKLPTSKKREAFKFLKLLLGIYAI